MHYTYIGAIERGERNLSLKAIEKFARGLGVTISDLFAFTSPEEKSTGEIELAKREVLALLNKRGNKTVRIVLKIVKDALQLLDDRDS